jgi:multicomponent Na+:H+ antiporter subunit D
MASGFCRRPLPAWLLALAATWTSAAIAIRLLWTVMSTGEPIAYEMGSWAVPWGIEYRVDRLNAFVLVLVSAVAAVIVPYARRSVAHEIAPHQQAWFYTMLLLCVAGLLGIAITGDAFNVFVFLEISSLSTYVLIALGRDRRALLSSYQYLIVGTIGATFYVIGIGLLYLVTGSLNILDIADRLREATLDYRRPVLAGLAFLTVGVCLKLALFPLHLWLPNAYAYAPSVATALLAGTATKVALYLLIRIFYTLFGAAFDFDDLGVSTVLALLSVAAMVLASLSAVFEGNLKRLLAYSSVAQIGYITLGIALANDEALAGAIVHLFNHAITKAMLFLAVGAMLFRVGSVRLEDLAGLGRTMPLTGAAVVVGGLGLIGVPGTAGFISKWYLTMGALQAGQWLLVAAIVGSSIIALVYVGRVVEVLYFREPVGAAAAAREPPWSMLAPVLLLAAAVIWFGSDTRATADVAIEAARALLGGPR